MGSASFLPPHREARSQKESPRSLKDRPCGKKPLPPRPRSSSPATLATEGEFLCTQEKTPTCKGGLEPHPSTPPPVVSAISPPPVRAGGGKGRNLELRRRRKSPSPGRPLNGSRKKRGSCSACLFPFGPRKAPGGEKRGFWGASRIGTWTEEGARLSGILFVFLGTKTNNQIPRSLQHLQDDEEEKKNCPGRSGTTWAGTHNQARKQSKSKQENQSGQAGTARERSYGGEKSMSRQWTSKNTCRGEAISMHRMWKELHAEW
nr:uncharacterized protein LOC110070895 [Pogona vitticeps]